MTDFITLFVSAGGIVTQIVVAIMVYCLIARKEKFELFTLIARHGIMLSCMVALIAMVTSLYYSEIALFAPCVLCWYQRIFMYPLVFILGYALLRNDRNVIPYGLVLSALGGFIALYQVILNYLEYGGTCSPTDTVSCTENYFTMFGYMTIPMLSLSAFMLIFVMLLSAKRYDSKNR